MMPILILDDTMNLGGIKVSSLELERVVDAHEAAYESAAVGLQPGGEADKLVVHVIPAREVDTGRLAAELGKMLAESSTRCSRSTTSSSPISFHALPPTNLCGASCALDTCVRRKHAWSEFEQA